MVWNTCLKYTFKNVLCWGHAKHHTLPLGDTWKVTNREPCCRAAASQIPIWSEEEFWLKTESRIRGPCNVRIRKESGILLWLLRQKKKKRYVCIISDNILLHVKGKPLIQQRSYFQMNSNSETSEQLCEEGQSLICLTGAFFPFLPNGM